MRKCFITTALQITRKGSATLDLFDGNAYHCTTKLFETMKYKKRIVARKALNHCYQRTRKGFLIFYSVSDYLVFFTYFCVIARKCRIKVLSLSLMPDHIHHAAFAQTRSDLSDFVGAYTRQFSRVHNSTCHWNGPLFEGPFGSAPKYGDKKMRTNLIYIGNNAPERNLCRLAEEYRWNFLAYAVSNHPYSRPLVLRTASFPLRMAVREVRSQFRLGRPLSYALLQRLFAKLGRDEKEQLVDFIIDTYNVIDYQAAMAFFGSYEQMLIALHSTTGNEYELKEVFNGKSDACYSRICSILMREYHFKDIHDVLKLSEEERFRIALQIIGRTDATKGQIAAFFRICPRWRDPD